MWTLNRYSHERECCPKRHWRTQNNRFICDCATAGFCPIQTILKRLKSHGKQSVIVLENILLCDQAPYFVLPIFLVEYPDTLFKPELELHSIQADFRTKRCQNQSRWITKPHELFGQNNLRKLRFIRVIY